ncbi:hypothetical protein [Bradyrhizobium cenepequi]
MSEIIERVARSIYEKRNGAGCKPWSIQTKAHKGPYLDDARAAIEAMREPTEAMRLAGELAPFDCSAEETWTAMIGAALTAAPAELEKEK